MRPDGSASSFPWLLLPNSAIAFSQLEGNAANATPVLDPPQTFTAKPRFLESEAAWERRRASDVGWPGV
jgi:hypothetical protein